MAKETLKSIVDNVIQTSSLVVTDVQEKSLYKEANELFFSIVRPIARINLEHRELLETKKEFETVDTLNLGFVGYGVSNYVVTKKDIVIQTYPLSDMYELSFDYMSEYRKICNYLLTKRAIENVVALGGSGLDITPPETIQREEIERALMNKFNFSLPESFIS